eukprot:2974929-Rhodomonas_salina.2
MQTAGPRVCVFVKRVWLQTKHVADTGGGRRSRNHGCETTRFQSLGFQNQFVYCGQCGERIYSSQRAAPSSRAEQDSTAQHQERRKEGDLQGRKGFSGVGMRHSAMERRRLGRRRANLEEEEQGRSETVS